MGLPDNFTESGLVPNFIPALPTALAEVRFGSVPIATGTELTTEQSQVKPHVSWPAEEGKYYCLIKSDPDIPLDIPADEILHWLVVNIPSGNLAEGEEIVEYIGASPPVGNPAHRYVIMIYEQLGKIDSEKFSNMTDEKKGKVSLRMSLQLKTIIQQLDLGQLVAANYYTAQPDENSHRFLQEVYDKY